MAKDRLKEDKVDSVLKKLAKAVEPALEEILVVNTNKKFHPIVKYQALTGGKRLRPALSIISCLMLGGKLKDILYPAAGLEILHNYSLIIDDMIDNSRLRRGKPTTWFKFGNSIAQCVGVYYAASIFLAANKSKKPTFISEALAKTIKTVFDGEILDILFERSGRENEPYVVKNRYRDVTEKDYFEMISKKTAVLFQASCEVGGICAGARNKQLEALRKYGFNYGMTFQITDDILDIFGKEYKFQKKIGGDIEERKEGNAVILCALKELSSVDRKKLLGILRKGKVRKKDIKEAMKLIDKTNSREKAHNMAERFAKKAKDALAVLPQNKWNDILAALVGFSLKREK